MSSGNNTPRAIIISTAGSNGLAANATATGVPTARAINLSTVAVDEFAANATVVGTLSATDLAGAGRTFSLVAGQDADGRFIVVGNELRVADGLRLDFEQQASYTVRLRVEDGAGGSFEQNFTISVRDITPETVFGDARANPVVGGTGNDQFYLGDGKDVAQGGAGDDLLVLQGGDDTGYGGEGKDTLLGGAGADVLLGEAGDDVLMGEADGDALFGGAGNDWLYSGEGKDVALGGAGKDVILLEGGDDYGYGGDELDHLFGGAGNDVLLGEAGDDVLFGEAGNDSLYGGAGQDTGFGGEGNDVFDMEAGNDLAYGNAGQDYFYMGDGNDVAFGGAGVDVFLGGAGNDVFEGGAGVDYAWGEAGDDSFALRASSGVMVVQDFTAGGTEDQVLLAADTGITSFAQALAASTYVASINTTILTVDADTAVWLVGVNKAQLTANDFAFGALTLDTTAPMAPTAALASDTGASNSDRITSNGLVNVNGLEAGASWEYSTNGGTSWTSGTGNTFTLAAGSYAADAVQLKQTDAVGNIGTTVTKLAAITVDSTAPAAPTAALASDTGSSNSDRFTSNGLVNLSGLEAGASWQYSTNGGTSWTNGTGNTFTLPAGSYAADAVQLKQTDAAGNTGTVTKLGTITVDATAPGAPEATLASDTGSSAADRITSNGQINVTGREEGSTWQYSTDSGANWTNGTGNSFTLAAGNYAADAVQVRQSDLAGNTGAANKFGAITVDATAPAAPTAALASDTGSSKSDGITSDGKINVSTLEAGASWQYSTNSGTSWTNGADTTFTLPAGNYAADAVQVKQTDVAGNTGTVTKLTAITVDSTAPGAPSAVLGNDTGSSNSDRITNNGALNVDGVEVGATWQYSTNSGNTWTNGTGLTFTLPAGSYAADAVQIKQTDVAGNTSTVTKLGAITVDTTAPGAPSAVLASDTGSSNSDRITSNGQLKVTLEGEGATWQYSTNSGTDWTNGTGNTFTLPAGSYAADAVQLKQTDVAGNTSTVTKLAATVVDSTAPAAPTATRAGTTVTVAGLEAGATWEYSTNTGTGWTPGTGTTFTINVANYAADAVQVRQIDVAGNTATAFKFGAITFDTTAPTAPTATLANDTGSSAADRITSDGKINVGGLEDGATWQYKTTADGAWIDGTGNTFTLPAGSYAADAVQVKQSDAAGNPSEVTKLAAITVDATAPAAPTAALASDTGSSKSDGITSDGKINVSALEAGASWQYSTNSGTSWTNGADTTFTLPAGNYAADAVQVKQTDVAGNTGTVTKLAAITVDSTAPGAPTAVLASDTGSKNNDGITKDGQVTVSGLEAGATWQYKTTTDGAWTDGTGTSFTLAAGSYAADVVQVRQTDVAGNAGTAVTKLGAITVDTTAPTTTTATRAGTTVTVAGLEDGATWEYSTNSGNSWTAGTGSSFTLNAGFYGADGVQVRQTDVAGNTATAFKFAAFTAEATLDLTTATTDALAGDANANTIVGAITASADTTTFHATDTVDGAGGTDTFNLTLSANSTAPFSLANVKNVEKYVITGAGTFDLSGSALDTVVTSVNASAHTGGLTLKLSTYQGITFTGGSGNDRITAGTALNAGGKVDAGTGTDTLVLTNASNQLLSAGNPTAQRWHGFEKLSVESGVADVSRLINSTISAIEVNGSATVTGLTAAQALNLTVAKQNATITFTPAGAGTTDRLKISYDDGDATLDEAIVSDGTNGLVLSGVERLELVAKDRVDASHTTADGSNTLKSVTISGAGQVSYTTNKVTTDGFTVDASAATGAVTVNATSAARSVTLTGGSGDDSLVGSALADTLTGGAGKDTLTGGAGADVFVFKTADIDTTAGVVTDEITDFTIGSDLVSLNFSGANAASFRTADAIDNSLADMLTLADQALNGTVRYYLGQVGSDAYLVTDQDGTGYTDVIKLTGKSINDLSADMVALMDGFNDPLLRSQWYIKNVGQRAETAATVPSRLYDLNVEKAWQQGFTGKGVIVGVSDDGIDLNHPDLQAALLKNLTKNFVNQATGATAYDAAAGFTPEADKAAVPNVSDYKAGQHSHGTVVGTIVAMTANNGTGMVGIAHGANLVSTLVVDGRANPAGNFTYLKNSGVAVSVNSYGADPAFSENYYIAPGTADADLNANQKSYKEIEDAATTGRGGLGMVVEVSAGNERANKADAGMTGFTNSRFIIASGSMDHTGKFASYTSPGASVLVSAFGGDGTLAGQSTNSGYGAVSGDVSDFTGNKGYNTTAGTAGNYAFANTGTSYSGPMVGATVALMLQANPGLGFRDVSEILAITARGVGNGNNYVTTKSTDWNMGGMHFSRDVGFGLVDVSAAVHVAQGWLKVPGNPAGTAANWQKAEAASANAAATIPDNDATGLTVTANITDNVRIERMEFDLKLNATLPSQLKAEVTSAAGTTIVLFDGPLTKTTKDANGVFQGAETAWPDVFQIGSTAFLGESSAGTWTLKLTDKVTGTVASYESLTVRAWGSAITDDSNYVFTNEYTGSKTLTDTAGNDTINAAAVSTTVVVNLNAGQVSSVGGRTLTIDAGTTIENVFGGMGNDVLTGNAVDNLLRGGWGFDRLAGGAAADTFSFALGDASALSPATIDNITDFTSGTDKIDFDIDLSGVAAAIASAGAGMAAIAANGLASFNAADTTLAQRLQAVMYSLDSAAAGTATAWNQAGNAYLYVTDGSYGLSTQDALIELTGVQATALGITGGDITSIFA